MSFWYFVLNLGILWQLVSVPGVVLTTIDFDSELNRISYLDQELVNPVAPQKIINDSLGVKLSASSALSMDWETGSVLWQKEADQKQSIASLTKLMTALVWLDFNPGWDKVVTIRESDYREGGRFYLFKGEQLTTQDLFRSTLIVSDNNAAVALARSTDLFLEDFVLKMNEKARQLDMMSTVFIEPTGLHAGNVSTINDVAKLVQAAFVDPDIRAVVGTQEAGYNIINTGRFNRLVSTNQLFGSFINVLAGKTGYSDEAGGCLAVLGEGEQGQKVLAIVLGSDDHYSRFNDVKALLQWTYNNFNWPEKIIEEEYE